MAGEGHATSIIYKRDEWYSLSLLYTWVNKPLAKPISVIINLRDELSDFCSLYLVHNLAKGLQAESSSTSSDKQNCLQTYRRNPAIIEFIAAKLVSNKFFRPI